MAATASADDYDDGWRHKKGGICRGAHPGARGRVCEGVGAREAADLTTNDDSCGGEDGSILKFDGAPA
ncbi:hypothetical protein CFC21_035245 [Triticum aestivum]|uniref:Uncharacterized protein n=3 Tax=Triticum TaxID=4564 RepID=A0A9R0RJL5_TRITD|nr:hypothetical protein CFC21_035245 [Triticum aestivum]VAH60875.1 unnamed protein product [Triticum turgidum subsp. durum]